MGVTVPAQYQSYVNAAAASLGISPSIVAAQIQTESSFNPNAVSPAGAEGIAQFLPSTFASYGSGSPYNVADAFAAYTAYMGSLLSQEGGNISNALAAYNAGPGNLSAGAGYASSILSLAGQPSGGTSTGVTGASDSTGGTDETASWLGQIFSWLSGVGPLQAVGSTTSSLVSGIGSGLEQGIFNAFWDLMKTFWKVIAKPLLWITEISFGQVFILVGAVILFTGTKVGGTASGLLAMAPGPFGAVGKGLTAISGVTGGSSGGAATSQARSIIRGSGRRTEPAAPARPRQVTTGQRSIAPPPKVKQAPTQDRMTL